MSMYNYKSSQIKYSVDGRSKYNLYMIGKHAYRSDIQFYYRILV